MNDCMPIGFEASFYGNGLDMDDIYQTASGYCGNTGSEACCQPTMVRPISEGRQHITKQQIINLIIIVK